ncbi:GFA family protein [Pseudomonas sp. S2_C03]
MTDKTAYARGACRCGQVTFESHCKPVITSACHCRGCQKMASSAFSLTALFPAGGFVVTQGSPVIGGLHGTTQHYFCPHCLSWLYTRPADTHTHVGVRSSLLDQPECSKPFMETWTREKLPWVQTGAAVSFEGFPELHEYPALMAEFAQLSD